MEERIRQMIEYYGTTPNMLERKIFVSEGTIYKFLSGKIGMKVTTLVKILEFFPDISPDWLLLGKGEMLRKNCQNNTENNQQTCSSNTYDSQAIISYLEKKVSDLQSDLADANRTIGELQYRLTKEGEKANSRSAQTNLEHILA